MIRGTFIHSVVEQFNRQHSLGEISTGHRAMLKKGKKQIRQIARNIWKNGAVEGWEDEVRDQLDEFNERLDNYIETIINRYRNVKRRTELGHIQALNHAIPTKSELPIRVVDEDGEWLFVGTIDAVYEHNPLWFGNSVLFDYKTGKPPYDNTTPMKANYSRQLNIYAWLFYQAFDVVPEVVGIHHLKGKPDKGTTFEMKEVDFGTIESTHMLIQRARQLIDDDNVEEYKQNTQYKWCEFEKKDGTTIKCDHWDYCLGNQKMPGPTDNNYDDEKNYIETTISDPRDDDLTFSRKSEAVLDNIQT